MKILLLGEYSNVHTTLARGLRELGHEVVTASNGDFWKNYPRDIDLARKPGLLGGIRLWTKVMANLHRFRGFDVVQLINPLFLELKADRHFWLFSYLKKHNKHVLLCAFGMDYYWVKQSDRKIFRYGDFNIGEELRHDDEAETFRRDWIGTEKEKLNRYVAENCDAIVSGLYEYDAVYRPLFGEKVTFIPFPIVQSHPSNSQTFNPSNSQTLKPSNSQTPKPSNSQTPKIKIFIGISKSRSHYKGTDIMLRAAEAVRNKYPEKVELKVAEGVPFAEYQLMMESSDLLLDQLYAYTPAMNALLAMSKGIIVVGGGEPENYEILDERELRPIINVQPSFESVYEELEKVVLHPEAIPVLKHQSIEYIKRHHDYLKVAQKYVALYKSL